MGKYVWRGRLSRWPPELLSSAEQHRPPRDQGSAMTQSLRPVLGTPVAPSVEPTSRMVQAPSEGLGCPGHCSSQQGCPQEEHRAARGGRASAWPGAVRIPEMSPGAPPGGLRREAGLPPPQPRGGGGAVCARLETPPPTPGAGSHTGPRLERDFVQELPESVQEQQLPKPTGVSD